MSAEHRNEANADVPPEDDWRTHATHKGSSTDYPSVSYFQSGDKVWYSPPDGRGMLGPYVIVVHLGNETYTIKKEDTGVQHAAAVPKSELARI